MQIKKELPLFLLLASLFTVLLLTARATQASSSASEAKEEPAKQCSRNCEPDKGLTPLNFITKGYFTSLPDLFKKSFITL